MGSVPAAPFNQFSHARTLAGPADTFVTINSDTLAGGDRRPGLEESQPCAGLPRARRYELPPIRRLS